MHTLRDDYLNAYRSLKLTRDAEGVLVVEGASAALVQSKSMGAKS